MLMVLLASERTGLMTGALGLGFVSTTKSQPVTTA
jgi:hypothetical protein